MPSRADLEEMSCVDIDKTDKSTLVDIKTVNIDKSIPIAMRIHDYLEQIKNPYCFLCNNTPVKIRFEDTGKEPYEAIRDHFIGLMQ